MRKPGVQLELDELRLNPGQEWGAPGGQWQFILLQSGMAYWLDGARHRELSQGEVLIISPGSTGVVRASQLSEAVLHGFSFEPDSLLGFFSFVEREWLESSAAGSIGSIGCLPSTHPIATEMEGLWSGSPKDCPLVERGKALVLALRIFAQFMPQQIELARRGAAARERFDEIISHMPDLELIQRSSHELAQLCGCTTRHFNRLFRIRFGKTTRVRQAELRLLKARELLEATQEPVAQIATTCGYRSLKLFSSLFRRCFGMSPSEWRQKMSTAKGRSPIFD